MDTGKILSEAVAYTQETFQGKWVRWLIFIILGLPMALLPFVFDVKKIVVGAQIHWELVPWGQVAAIVFAGIILSFFLSGYLVRVYRGAKPAPDFDNWGGLFVDGLKLAIVSVLWFLPVFIVVLCIVGIAIVAGTSGGAGSMALTIGLVLLALLIMLVVSLIVILFSPMGIIRFARTGSITEGLRYSKISELIGKIGWGQYVIALVVLLVVTLIFVVIEAILQLIPWIGWVLVLIITPLLSVFVARFYTLIYEQGELQPASP